MQEAINTAAAMVAPSEFQAWAAVARAAAPARFAQLVERCNTSGPMRSHGHGFDGFDVAVEAARWGRWQVLRRLAQAGAELGHVWSCDVTGLPINAIGIALGAYHDLVETDLMCPDLRLDFVRTVAVLVEAAGPLALVPVPAPLAQDLADDLLTHFGIELLVVDGYDD